MKEEYPACRGPNHDGTPLFGVSQVQDRLSVLQGDGQHGTQAWDKILASTLGLFMVSIQITSQFSEIVV
jgi:hypothetical protein